MAHRNPNSVTVSVPLPFKLLQVLRLTHALMESGYRVCIPESEREKFDHLRRYFELNFECGPVQNSEPLGELRISHEEPLTQIGSLGRPLILPHGMFDYCQRLWQKERPIRFAFVGHIRSRRQNTLEQWFHRVDPSFRISASDEGGFWSRIAGVLKPSKAASSHDYRSAELLCRASDSGRKFPGKAWDDDYFRTMAGARFVVCPNGDFVWTYRFFEAILCGAIPVVEEKCPLYEGYFFYTMQDEPADLQWSEQNVHDNLTLARKQLTVPLDDLNHEIGAILERARSQGG